MPGGGVGWISDVGGRDRGNIPDRRCHQFSELQYYWLYWGTGDREKPGINLSAVVELKTRLGIKTVDHFKRSNV